MNTTDYIDLLKANLSRLFTISFFILLLCSCGSDSGSMGSQTSSAANNEDIADDNANTNNENNNDNEVPDNDDQAGGPSEVVDDDEQPQETDSGENNVDPVFTPSEEIVDNYSADFTERVVGETLNISNSFDFQPIAFVSSDSSIATVDASGNIEFQAAGRVTITAQDESSAPLNIIQKTGDLAVLSAVEGNSITFDVTESQAIMTAWIGAEDTWVNLNDGAQGFTLVRSTDRNCDFLIYTSCANAEKNVVSSATIVDTTTSLTNTGYYGFFYGENFGGSSLQNSEIFDPRSAYTFFEFDGALWLIGGRDNNSSNFYKDIWRSEDGDLWIKVVDEAPFLVGSNISVIEWQNKIWAIGGSGPGKSSTDSESLSDEVWSSPDGINWTLETDEPGFAGRYNALVYATDDAIFVGGGASLSGFDRYYPNDLWKSTDGKSWSLISAEFMDLKENYKYAYEYFKGTHWIYSMKDYQNEAWRSSDGETWESFSPSISLWGDDYYFSTIYRNQLWLITLFNEKLYLFKSSDGITWLFEGGGVLLGNLEPIHTQMATLNDRIFVAGGYKTNYLQLSNGVWSTQDGFDWHKHSRGGFYGIRSGHGMVEHDGKLWSVGGRGSTGFDSNDLFGSRPDSNTANPFKSDVWVSDDGNNWQKVTEDAGFTKRAGHALLSYDDALWVIAGEHHVGSVAVGSTSNGETILASFTSFTGANNEVWRSENGMNWENVQASAPFPLRLNFKGIVFNNKMWMIGGSDGDNYYADIWSSSDGINWTEENSAAAFEGREGHALTVHNGQLYLSGGKNANGEYLDDVWKSGDGVAWTRVVEHFSGFEYIDFELVDSEGTIIDWIFSESDRYMRRRAFHAMVSLDNRLYIIGGRENNHPALFYEDSTVYLGNDVWVSEDDGATWRILLANEFAYSPEADRGPFMPRMNHQAVVFNGDIIMTGGKGDDGLYTEIVTDPQFLRDVWRSNDGANWRYGYTTEMNLLRIE